jgi:long-chain acyl-CoA synthetase
MPRFNLGDLADETHDCSRPALFDCLDWDHPRAYSHSEIDASCDSLARGLLRRGLRRGNRVAIISGNRAEFLITYFGVMRAGLVAVPINHKLPADTVDFVLGDVGATLVFCDAERRALVPAGYTVVQFGEDFDSLLDAGAFETVRPERGETAMILYTSGSTGRPKGVPLSHDGQLWTVETRLRSGPAQQHRLLIAAPLFHINALGASKFAFAANASMVLLPQFDAKHYLEAIERFRCTWLTSVPTMLALVTRETELLARTDVSSVQFARMGSAPLTQKLIDDVQRAFPGASVGNGYGTTEAGPMVFTPQHPDGRKAPPLSLGWPAPRVELRIVGTDGSDANEGELWQRTPANMSGYLNLPEKTAQVLTPDGWYMSGDIFRRDEQGVYWFVGRADDMFVCGGENIYPGEVEQMLERHADVVQACVVPVPDEIKGEKPFAFIVTRPGSKLTEADVKGYALEHAPAYQHPRQVEFLGELPLAGTNKVDRKALSARALELWRAGQGRTA